MRIDCLMEKLKKLLLSALAILVFISFVPCNLHAAKEAEALLLLPTEDIEDYPDLSKDLESGDARILEAYSANIFRGYIPKDLEMKLKKKYGAKVFRERITYMADFAPFGEIGMLAAAKWNKYVQEEPDDAPLIINMTTNRIGRKGKYLKLCWNKVHDAIFYRLQVSRSESFKNISLRTATKNNCQVIMPKFWPDGVHYWRVAPVFKTVKKGVRDGEFSAAANFAVANTVPQKKSANLEKPKIPKDAVKGRNITWQPCDQPYYRLQFSETDKFDLPLADLFTDVCSYKASSLRLKHGSHYFFRIMSSDGNKSSAWSDPAEFEYNSRPAYKNNI